MAMPQRSGLKTAPAGPVVRLEQRGTPQAPAVVRVLPSERTKAGSDSDAREKTAHNNNEYLVAIGTVALAIVTLLLTIGTAILAGYTYRLWKSTERMAKEASTSAADQGKRTDRALELTEQSIQLAREAHVADHRAWLRVDVAIVSDLTREPGAYRLALQFRMTNVGRTPAMHAKPAVQVFVTIGDIDLAAQQRNVSDEQRRRNVGPHTFGLTIFPNESESFTIGTYVSETEIARADAWFHAAHGKHAPSLLFCAVGCVDYVLGAGGEHRQTGFILDLHHIDPQFPGRRLAFDRRVDRIAASELLLAPNITLRGITD